MKNIFTALMMVTIVIGAKAQEKPPKPNPARTEAVIYRNASLSIKQGEDNDSINIYPKMGAGKKWVIQYSYQAPEYPEMTDDEYYESLIFEIDPPKTNRFKLKDKQLSDAKAVFQKSCFCADRGYFKVSEGSIAGTKVNNNTWQIIAAYTVPAKRSLSSGPLKKKFSARFRIQIQEK